MQAADNQMYQEAAAHLSQQRVKVKKIYAAFESARHLSDSDRSWCRIRLFVSVPAGLASAYLGIQHSSEIPGLLALPVYPPWSIYTRPALLIALSMFSLFYLASALRLLTLMRDDREGHLAMSRLTKLGNEIAGQIQEISTLTTEIQKHMQGGKAAILYGNQSIENDIQRLERQSAGWKAKNAPASRTLVNMLYWVNAAAWSTAAIFLSIGAFINFVSSTQSWYAWNVSTQNLARWAYPAALLALLILFHVIRQPEDGVYTVSRLTILFALIPLAFLLGWCLVGIPALIKVLILIIIVVVIVIIVGSIIWAWLFG